MFYICFKSFFGEAQGRHDLDLTIRQTAAARARPRTGHALANAGRWSFGQQTGEVHARGASCRSSFAAGGRRNGGGQGGALHPG